MKNYYYVLVLQDDDSLEKARFVTAIDGRTALWEYDKAPLLMSKERAQDIAKGLTLNGYLAYAIVTDYKVEANPPQPSLDKCNPVLIQFHDYGNSAEDFKSYWYTVFLNGNYSIEDLKDMVAQVYEDNSSDISFYERFEEELEKHGASYLPYADPQHYLLYNF